MPIAFVFGVPPAYEIMANFSGLHMDIVGRDGDGRHHHGPRCRDGAVRDASISPCRQQAEIVVEGRINLERQIPQSATSPRRRCTTCRICELLPEVEITAITMRADRPIYRNHQTCPDTDHQPLPRLCHEAVLYNRLTEMGLDVKDVRFPTWGAALSCILQFDYPREGFVNDALMTGDGRALAQHQDGGRGQPRHRYRRSRATSIMRWRRACDPARDIVIVPQHPRLALRSRRQADRRPGAAWRVVGKIGIDATAKSRHDIDGFRTGLAA